MESEGAKRSGWMKFQGFPATTYFQGINSLTGLLKKLGIGEAKRNPQLPRTSMRLSMMISTIAEALSDKDLLRPLFEDKETGLIAESWQNWFSILAMINGDKLTDKQLALYQKLSGNSYYVPIERKEIWLSAARRSGKSYFISGLVSASALLLYANDKLRRANRFSR